MFITKQYHDFLLRTIEELKEAQLEGDLRERSLMIELCTAPREKPEENHTYEILLDGHIVANVTAFEMDTTRPDFIYFRNNQGRDVGCYRRGRIASIIQTS